MTTANDSSYRGEGDSFEVGNQRKSVNIRALDDNLAPAVEDSPHLQPK